MMCNVYTHLFQSMSYFTVAKTLKATTTHKDAAVMQR